MTIHQAGYRAPSQKWTFYLSSSSVTDVIFFIVESYTLSALCVYSMFGHHPHPLATFVPNFVSFTASIAEPANGEKLHSQSLTQLI